MRSSVKVLYLHSSVRAFSVQCITSALSADFQRGIVPCFSSHFLPAQLCLGFFVRSFTGAFSSGFLSNLF